MAEKYLDVVTYILNQVAGGELKPGARVPSIRELAQRCNCSRATVIRAYEALEREHKLYSVPKSGYYLLEAPAAPGSDGGGETDFSFISPGLDMTPHRDFQHCLNQALEMYRDRLFGYSDPQGQLSLRRVLARQFQNHQIFAAPEDVFVTTGSQQALALLAKMPFPNGRANVLTEQPTFRRMLELLELEGITALGIERNEDGVDFDQLERLFRTGNIKLFYTIPRFHNPCGTSYTQEQKKQLLRLAQQYDVYIVEDDYLAEFDTDRRADPIYALDRSGHTIYVTSYSKVLFPGLRVGAAVLPRLLANRFRDYKQCADLCTPILSQGALEIYLKSGMFSGHLRRIRQAYGERQAVAQRLLAALLPPDGSLGRVYGGGLFCYWELPAGVSGERLRQRLEADGILISAGTPFYLPAFRRGNTVRLSWCRTTADELERGLPRVAEEAARLAQRAPRWQEDCPAL